MTGLQLDFSGFPSWISNPPFQILPPILKWIFQMDFRLFRSGFFRWISAYSKVDFLDGFPPISKWIFQMDFRLFRSGFLRWISVYSEVEFLDGFPPIPNWIFQMDLHPYQQISAYPEVYFYRWIPHPNDGIPIQKIHFVIGGNPLVRVKIRLKNPLRNRRNPLVRVESIQKIHFGIGGNPLVFPTQQIFLWYPYIRLSLILKSLFSMDSHEL